MVSGVCAGQGFSHALSLQSGQGAQITMSFGWMPWAVLIMCHLAPTYMSAAADGHRHCCSHVLDSALHPVEEVF